jgi:hypothetical protein
MIQTELELDIEKGFMDYHRENPQIYAEFERVAMNYIGMGLKRYSAKGIFEALRFESSIRAKDGVFKINNNFTPLYARLFEQKHPEIKNFFRKRESKFDHAETH